MTTNPKGVSQEEPDDRKKQRLRSPAYPYINLETAITRAQTFYDREVRNAAPLAVAATDWGYEAKSSSAMQTAAALMSFGLLSDEGTGDKRKVRLTQNALKILLDKRPDSVERAELIKQAALAPKIHQQIWEKWGDSVSDGTLRHALIFEWKPPFNENSVDGFIREFRDTISFAKLTESDKVATEDGDKDTGRAGYIPKVGDYVQWESNGILQFPQSKRVTEISADGKYAMVEGSYTGLPIGELSLAKTPQGLTIVPPPEPRIQVSPNIHMQEFVVPLSDSKRAVFQWPNILTKEDIDDLKDSLKVVERQIARSMNKKSEEEKSE
ncbi:MAG TPA: hypothetical protein VLA42_15965 [Verrucomicrobiae bacterium]|jgi:hypothetical protein|nr:hypothetical protein [Verrucomicrobiae bacterium]